jgi:hypothetical protein
MFKAEYRIVEHRGASVRSYQAQFRNWVPFWRNVGRKQPLACRARQEVSLHVQARTEARKRVVDRLDDRGMTHGL